MHEEEEARDEEGGPEGEAEEAAAAEDVDDAADEGEDHLARLRHARRGLDKVRVPSQSHAVVISHLKCTMIMFYSASRLLGLQMYRVSHSIMQRGFFGKVLGSSPACGQLLHAARYCPSRAGELPKTFPKNLSV